MHSVILSIGVTVRTCLVIISFTGVSLKDFPFRMALRVQSRSETIPTNLSLFSTGNAPTFFSSINWMTSPTVAFGPTDHTLKTFLCAKIALTFPLTFIFSFNLLQRYVYVSNRNSWQLFSLQE